MKTKISLFLAIVFFLILISASLIFGQNEVMQSEALPQEELIMPEQVIPEGPAQSEVQWVWGEVVSVNIDTKQIVVKYLDYETDTEKEMGINVDDKTTYENVKSIDEIMSSDTLSIDYIVTPEGKNIAKNISLEKPESLDNMQREMQGMPVEGEIKREDQP